MDMLSRYLAMVIGLGLAVACSRRAPAPLAVGGDESFAGRRAEECSKGRLIDSAYVVRVAAEAFGPDGPRELKPIGYQPVTAPGSPEEGVLVRLVPVAPTLGGGGLVFVDIESGCAIALRRYE